jgi:hypothetical protein
MSDHNPVFTPDGKTDALHLAIDMMKLFQQRGTTGKAAVEAMALVICTVIKSFAGDDAHKADEMTRDVIRVIKFVMKHANAMRVTTPQ